MGERMGRNRQIPSWDIPVRTDALPVGYIEKSLAHDIGDRAFGVEKDPDRVHTYRHLEPLFDKQDGSQPAAHAAEIAKKANIPWDTITTRGQIALLRIIVHETAIRNAYMLHAKGNGERVDMTPLHPFETGLDMVTTDMAQARGIIWEEQPVLKKLRDRQATLHAFDAHLQTQQAALPQREPGFVSVVEVSPQPTLLTVIHSDTKEPKEVNLSFNQKRAIAYLAELTKAFHQRHRQTWTTNHELAKATHGEMSARYLQFLLCQGLQHTGVIETNTRGMRLASNPDTLLDMLKSNDTAHTLTVDTSLPNTNTLLLDRSQWELAKALSRVPKDGTIALDKYLLAASINKSYARTSEILGELAALGIVHKNTLYGKYYSDTIQRDIVDGAARPIKILVGIGTKQSGPTHPQISWQDTDVAATQNAEVHPDFLGLVERVIDAQLVHQDVRDATTGKVVDRLKLPMPSSRFRQNEVLGVLESMGIGPNEWKQLMRGNTKAINLNEILRKTSESHNFVIKGIARWVYGRMLEIQDQRYQQHAATPSRTVDTFPISSGPSILRTYHPDAGLVVFDAHAL